MKSENINDLINKVKSNNEQTNSKNCTCFYKEIEEIQFSFYIEKRLIQKIKIKKRLTRRNKHERNHE